MDKNKESNLATTEKSNETNNKKQRNKIITAVYGLLIALMFIGTSYALWSYGFIGDTNKVENHSIELEFLESSSEIINMQNVIPVSDDTGKNQSDYFAFQVKTKTINPMDLTYYLYVEKLAASDDYTLLSDKQVKIYLTDYQDNKLIEPTLISNLDNYLIYTKTNSHSADNEEIIDKYKLRIWVDDAVTGEGWTEDTKIQYRFKIGVTTEKREKTIPAAETLITSVGQSGLEELEHAADSTLQIGATEDITEYRFRGGDDIVTNNYVYFNCEDINNQTSSTCELYRIIGVFPVDDGTGNIENRIKLIKAENYGNNYWNSNGTNNWAEPATLNTTFNTTYWGTINEKYQALVGDAKYYLGGYHTSPSIRTSVMYGYERKIDESDGGNYYYNINPTNWTGKLALMYASDYGYAANSACSESTNLYDYETNSCPDNNWLYLGSTEWILPQYSFHSDGAFGVYSSGYVSGSDGNIAVRPVLYLTSDAQFNNTGDGSVDNPYQLKG